jgi:hypothetical protein
MTDISISDIARISHHDMDRKLAQLDRYIHKVGHRIQALKRLAQPIKDTPSHIDTFVHQRLAPCHIKEVR